MPAINLEEPDYRQIRESGHAVAMTRTDALELWAVADDSELADAIKAAMASPGGGFIVLKIAE